ncbi:MULTISPECIES: TadE/TadG family type IV pilus assembly protein [unclassified Novosphingobium]|uniref:TadE/TadG family type IV pilus assembly protein n=1 Tax=unclassified Novosphingobium TaxID=2644732 RepID=UPI0025FCDD65|nr:MULTISPECIES: TadE/TadG family type IV pilus assembly protein [unclassified Novosphingobium]HQV03044.1 TadE/TadG family type IV pilus assembly protein [Novosphingobium sp.]
MAGLSSLRKAPNLASDSNGVTVVEFALIAPVFLLMLLGTFDLGQAIYLQGVFHGAVQDAGRDAGLESGAANLTAIDNQVMLQIKSVAPAGAIISSRRNYTTFNDVGTPEDFEDANNNNVYDDNECFTDVNGNDQWDSDRAANGLGGADDVVVYTATLSYDRIVPIGGMMGWSDRNTISASTVLRNQPFGSQAARPEKQVCPT